MIKLRLFPNSTDNFYIAYRLTQILSNRYNISGQYIMNNSSLPSIPSNYISLLDCSVPENSPSVWFGAEDEMGLDLYRNYFFITSHSNIKKTEVLSKSDKTWYFDKDFIFPYKEIKCNNKENAIFLFINPTNNISFEDIVKSFLQSKTEYELRVISICGNIKHIKQYIGKLRGKYNSSNKIKIACPLYVSPDTLIDEISKCNAVIDIRRFSGASFSTLLAHSCGIPSITSQGIFPIGLKTLSPVSVLSTEGASYAETDLISTFDNIHNMPILSGIDNSNDVYLLFDNIIHNNL